MNAPLFVAESPAAYARRPRLVVDASVVAAALFAEKGLEHASNWMQGRALCAPQLVDYELANAALFKARRGAISGDAAALALEAFALLDLERHAVDAAQVLRLASRYDLTAYDASYLWLAESLGAPLATFDRMLGAAARRHLAGDES